jgi:hypothetical protein
MLGVDSTTSVGVLLLSGPARSCSFFFSARFGLSSRAGLSTCDEFDFLLVDFGFSTVAAAGLVVALWFVLRFTGYHHCRAVFHSAAHRSSIPLATAGARPDFFLSHRIKGSSFLSPHCVFVVTSWSCMTSVR